LNKKDILFDKRFDNSELGHWSDHKKYTRKVEEALKDLINDLEAKYGKTLEAMTPEELQKAKPDILREVRKVQEKFKQQIKDGTAPNVITPNGQKRIAFIPYQQREWSIRV
jgi:translation initiation factor 2 alpha subunit (eIF-2alpha)